MTFLPTVGGDGVLLEHELVRKGRMGEAPRAFVSSKPAEVPPGYVLTLVDDCDVEPLRTYEWLIRECASGNRYAYRVRVNSSGWFSRVLLHRVVTEAGPGQVVDHRNGNGLDNRRSNLRLCSSRENARHRPNYVARKRREGSFVGVWYRASDQLWVAYISAGPPRPNGWAKRISLKYHATAEAAARAYDSAAHFYFGEFASLNFPEETPAPFDPTDIRGTPRLSREERSRLYSEAGLRNGSQRGEKNGYAKLNPASVAAIRASKETAAALALRFGISKSHVSNVRRGDSWRTEPTTTPEVTDRHRVLVCRELSAFWTDSGKIHLDQAMAAYEDAAKARLSK